MPMLPLPEPVSVPLSITISPSALVARSVAKPSASDDNVPDVIVTSPSPTALAKMPWRPAPCTSPTWFETVTSPPPVPTAEMAPELNCPEGAASPST